MIRVTIYTNAGRQTISCAATDTLKKALDDNGIAYATAQLQLDGAPLGPGEINKTFEAFGISAGGECALAAIVKTSNAK